MLRPSELLSVTDHISCLSVPSPLTKVLKNRGNRSASERSVGNRSSRIEESIARRTAGRRAGLGKREDRVTHILYVCRSPQDPSRREAEAAFKNRNLWDLDAFQSHVLSRRQHPSLFISVKENAHSPAARRQPVTSPASVSCAGRSRAVARARRRVTSAPKPVTERTAACERGASAVTADETRELRSPCPTTITLPPS